MTPEEYNALSPSQRADIIEEIKLDESLWGGDDYDDAQDTIDSGYLMFHELTDNIQKMITSGEYDRYISTEFGDPLYGNWDQNGWFFGIQNLTRDDHQGAVYWKGEQVEHFDHDYFQSDGWERRMKEDAIKVAEKCKRMEAEGIPVNYSTYLNYD